MIKKQIQTVAMDEIYKRNSDGYIPVLLDIYNPDIKWNDNSLEQDDMHLRVVADSNNVKYKGKRYLACKFEFKPPEQDGTKVGSASITLSALDTRVTQMLRMIDLVCEVDVVTAFAKNGSQYKFIPLDEYKMQMKSSTYSRTTANLVLSPDDVWSLNVPRDVATKDRFPSCNENS